MAKVDDRAPAGEEIVLAKDGKPWARPVPLAARPARVPGRYPFRVPSSFFAALPEDDIQDWECQGPRRPLKFR